MTGETEIVLIVALICSYLAVKVWVNARRAEREALYRSEAVKRIAEMQGNVPDAVLQILRDATAPRFEPPSSINYDYNREREAFYRSEAVKKIAETGGAAAALDYLREEEKKADVHFADALKLGGLITFAVGIGLTFFLWKIEAKEPVYLVGLIPILVGLVLVVFAVTKRNRS